MQEMDSADSDRRHTHVIKTHHPCSVCAARPVPPAVTYRPSCTRFPRTACYCQYLSAAHPQSLVDSAHRGRRRKGPELRAPPPPRMPDRTARLAGRSSLSLMCMLCCLGIFTALSFRRQVHVGKGGGRVRVASRQSPVASRALYPPATRYPNGGWVPCFVGWMGR